MTNDPPAVATPLREVETAVERLMHDDDPPQTMSELGAQLEQVASGVPSSVRRLVIQRLLGEGKLVLSDDRALRWA